MRRRAFCLRMRARYGKRLDFVTREIAGETLFVPVRNRVGDLDSIFVLNEVGTSIWRLIDGQTTVDRIVEAIVGEFDVETGVAEKDVSSFLRDMETAGLIGFADKTEG